MCCLVIWERQSVQMENKDTEKIMISIIGFSQGGAEIMPIRIANYLHRHGYKVAVHCLSMENDEKIRDLLLPDIPVFYTDSSVKLAAIILRNGYRIIHTHSVASQLLVDRMRRRVPFLRIRHIATSHGGYEGMDSAEAEAVLRKIDRSVECWTYVADNNLQLFESAAIDKKKLYKIGNAMEISEEIQPVCWKDYGIPEDALVFCVITRAVWKKSWPQCIEAVKKAREETGRNIHLVMCGTGPVYEQLKQEAQNDFVHLVGSVKNPCDFYKASYCGLLLSVRECAPLGIIEMYHAQVPVVATDTGDIAEMMQFDDGQTGILVPLTEEGEVSVPKAAEAISKMVLLPEFYEECRNNAAKKAYEYSMDYVMEKYLRCY